MKLLLVSTCKGMLLKVQYISVIVQLITELFDNLEIFLVLLTDWPEPDSDVILDA